MYCFRLRHLVSHWECGWRHLLGALKWASVSCTKRNGNRVAHMLVRYAQNVNVDSFWKEEVPSVAVEYVNIDVSLI